MDEGSSQGIQTEAISMKSNRDEESYPGALYARGYVISCERLHDALAELHWNEIAFSYANTQYYVYHDPRVDVFCRKDGTGCVLLLGIVVDPERETQDKKVIADKLLSLVSDEDSFWDYEETLCGRYLIVYGLDNELHLVQDASGMRTCYYAQGVAASHYGLVSRIRNLPEHSFYKRYIALGDKKPWYLPGSITPVEGVKTLLPNHALCFNDMKIRRIFPRKTCNPLSAVECVTYGAKIFTAQAKILSEKYKLLVSLTGGNDSRVTLSALREVKDKVKLFVYDTMFKDNVSRGMTSEYDNRMAQYLAETFGMKLYRFELEKYAPRRFSKV